MAAQADKHSVIPSPVRPLCDETCRRAIEVVNVSSGSEAENHSRWKLSFTNDSYMESVNGGCGRRFDGHL